MTGRLSMVFLYTADLPRLSRFYGETLGLEEKWRDEGESVWFDTGAATLVLHRPQEDFAAASPVAGAGGVLLWLEVEEGIEEHYRALQEAGVTMTVPLRRWPVRTVFCVEDPDGRRIGFFQSHSEPPHREDA